MIIRNAKPTDAAVIAWAVMEAVGPGICTAMGGDKGLEAVENVFSSLAGSDDSQYSWQNTRVAVSDRGEICGVCVTYDGADLRKLRRTFFRKANELLGWNVSEEEVEAIPEETDSTEFYLDSLAVKPKFRGKGIGRKLIADAFERAKESGKPLGLLVEEGNDNARRLYDSLGFRYHGKRRFAGVYMNHLVNRGNTEDVI